MKMTVEVIDENDNIIEYRRVNIYADIKFIIKNWHLNFRRIISCLV